MRLDDLNFMDVEDYLKQDDRILLVMGACEQHGYLSLMTDTRIPQVLADAVSQKSGVLVAPAVNFGVSPYFLTYPGTISLRVSTYLDLVEDVVRSLYGQGFRRFVALNGHGGNAPATARLVELGNALPDLQLSWYSWWQAQRVTETAAQHGLVSRHAAWIEAFKFCRVTELPQGEKESFDSHYAVYNAARTRAEAGDGVYGGKYQVSDEIMDELFKVMVEDVLDLLKFEKFK